MIHKLEYSVERSGRTHPYAAVILRILLLPLVILGLALVLYLLDGSGGPSAFLESYIVEPFLWLLISLCALVWILLWVLLISTFNNNRRAAHAKRMG